MIGIIIIILQCTDYTRIPMKSIKTLCVLSDVYVENYRDSYIPKFIRYLSMYDNNIKLLNLTTIVLITPHYQICSKRIQL